MIHDTGYYHVFPFQEVGKGENIIIWGMGEVGQQYVQQVKKTDYCHVSFCVDKGWESMTRYMDVPVMSPEKVRGRNERIVIANGNGDVAGKIMQELMRYGIRNEKILYHDLICENQVSIKENNPKKQIGSNFLEKYSNGKKKEVIDVGFYIIGGLGDLLINYNYILAFKNKFKDENINIEVYFQPFRKYISAFLAESLKEVDKISFDEKEMKKSEKEADFFILIQRYPWVRRLDLEKIKILSPNLAKYALMMKEFEIDNSRYYGNRATYDGVSAMESEAMGVRRFNQCDIYGFLSMGDRSYIKFPNLGKDTFQKFRLPQKYITINRDIDSVKADQKGSVLKLWPTEYYNELIRLLKIEYPGMMIIVVGVNCDSKLTGYDVDLVGKTTPVEFECILKNSSLHICSEGGSVHLRHFLGGGMSVVMFGPTSPKFYGYDENLNLRSASCEHPCEWTTSKWTTNCINKKKRHSCMMELTPDFVINEIKRSWVL